MQGIVNLKEKRGNTGMKSVDLRIKYDLTGIADSGALINAYTNVNFYCPGLKKISLPG